MQPTGGLIYIIYGGPIIINKMHIQKVNPVFITHSKLFSTIRLA